MNSLKVKIYTVVAGKKISAWIWSDFHSNWTAHKQYIFMPWKKLEGWTGLDSIKYCIIVHILFMQLKKKSVSCWPSSGFVSLTVGVQHRSLLRSKLGANYSHAYAVVFRDCIDVLFVLRNGEIKAFTVVHDHMNRIMSYWQIWLYCIWIIK